jgi:predicted enzyme related to lactoylglutathione lyase
VAHVVHFEFSVPDPQQAATFYQEAFGWSATKLPDPIRYWQLLPANASAPSAIPGGVVQSKTGESRVSLTIQVEDLAKACATVIRLGATMITQPQLIPGFGTHVLCRDPQGCFFALLEPPTDG